VAADHPALAGHFPDQPLVPGVVVLEHVVAAAERAFGVRQPIAIPSVKFLAPLGPGEPFRIILSRRARTCITFECRRQATILTRGRLIFAE
jgi:3-hydroxymyristoyl/3-hydroxydecanoyl-(acyl carrier protein) dehydratase